MTARRAFALLALALLAVGFWFWKTRLLFPATSAPSTPVANASAQAQTENAKPKTTAPDSAGSAPERSSLADALNSPQTDIHTDLRLVTNILETFRTNFPSTGNPTGTNAEITAVLTGKNKLRLALIPSDHPAINRTGELCDRWGTPFFFHSESATRTEIRSAGPDKKLWTDDDVTFAP